MLITWQAMWLWMVVLEASCDGSFFSTFLQAMFSEGNIIVLQSQASRTNIRICDGEVQGSKDDGPACQGTRTHTYTPINLSPVFRMPSYLVSSLRCSCSTTWCGSSSEWEDPQQLAGFLWRPHCWHGRHQLGQLLPANMCPWYFLPLHGFVVWLSGLVTFSYTYECEIVQFALMRIRCPVWKGL